MLKKHNSRKTMEAVSASLNLLNLNKKITKIQRYSSNLFFKNSSIKSNKSQMDRVTDLHGVPWFNEGADQVQVFHRFFDLLSPAAGLVAGE